MIVPGRETSRRQNIAADVPASLQDADDLLRRYGRWAMNRRRKMRCGSAEGDYDIPSNDDDRNPREQLLLNLDALDCQRALAKVPDLERVVLSILYVPQRIPAEAQLRILRIPPRLSQVRHITGLRMFSNIHRALTAARNGGRIRAT